jgi:hypothetical protein
MNLFIGLYVGHRGSRFFMGVGPAGILLWFLCIGGFIYVRYAQNNYGYHASLKHITLGLAFGVVGWIVGRVLRREK